MLIIWEKKDIFQSTKQIFKLEYEKYMHNYVISVKNSYKRREHITQEFSKHHILFDFFDAITLETIERACNELSISLENSQLSDGEKACFLSHLCLWKKCIDKKLDYIAVFEDDVYLGKDANSFFMDHNWLNNNQFDFIKTETFLQERKLAFNSIDLPNNRKIRELKEPHLGTAGYIISQKAAISLLNYVKSFPEEKLLPIDHMMFEQYLYYKSSSPIYQMIPAIVAQEFILYPNQNNMPSSIEESRLLRKQNKQKRPLLDKIAGELSNLFRKTLGKLLRTRVTFY